RFGTARFQHPGLPLDLCWLADGRTLMSATSEGVRRWDVASGRRVGHWPLGADVESCTLASDGGFVFLRPRCGSVEGYSIEIWDGDAVTRRSLEECPRTAG